MEELRAKGRQLKDGVKKQMYDESGQLNAWNKLKENDAEFRPAALPSNMDLTPEGMKLKKVSRHKFDIISEAWAFSCFCLFLLSKSCFQYLLCPIFTPFTTSPAGPRDTIT